MGSTRSALVHGIVTLGHPHRSTPLVEQLDYIGLAELDSEGTLASSLCVVPLKRAVDPSEHYPNRDLLLSPPIYQLERGTDDPNQVAVVLATEVRLDFATVSARIHSTLPATMRSIRSPH